MVSLVTYMSAFWIEERLGKNGKLSLDIADVIAEYYYHHSFALQW